MKRKKLLRLTAASGSLENLQVALDNAGLIVGSEILEAAAEASQLHVCVALRQRGTPWGRALASAAAAGQLHVCEWLLASGCPFDPVALDEAALGGHEALTLRLVQLQPELRNPPHGNGAGAAAAAAAAAADRGDDGGDEDDGEDAGVGGDAGDARRARVAGLLVCAAEGFRLAAFQRLLQLLLPSAADPAAGEGGPREHQQQQQQQQPAVSLTEDQCGRILAAAAAGPSPDWQAKMEWLEGLGYPRTPEAVEFASKCARRTGPGSGTGSGPDADAPDAAARLRWLRDRGYPLHELAVDHAAARGDVAALRVLTEQWGDASQTPPPPALPPVGDGGGGGGICLAAHYGHLAALQYLHEAGGGGGGGGGGVLNALEVAYGGATGGDLPVVAWAVEVLGGVTPESAGGLLDVAASSGSLQLMEWLVERGWGWSARTMAQAAWCGCEEALEWLVERGCPWPADGRPYVNAAIQRDLATLRTLHRLGCPWRPKLLNAVIRCAAPLPLLRCLRELGCPVDWRQAAQQAEAAQRAEYREALREWVAEELAGRGRQGCTTDATSSGNSSISGSSSGSSSGKSRSSRSSSGCSGSGLQGVDA
ncbi:hypothetical protein PLESTB_000894900 [Pleodorina starrii]|uniref:Ankyrin repeat domain-containing protein n=1 Tax=Pleodorina starrii TaxID=330485 RepID=A0A9W6BNM8_9CHLO|nr:hypothetical protein PLESTM_000886100 [Pleodorina starrii]GLC54681.1 hypothetical protein PLESTB_000894900 [Pleodorina starrii]GLC67019.1 hypothetical protein PLESTF_000502700 [Pleodorina starrii]